MQRVRAQLGQAALTSRGFEAVITRTASRRWMVVALLCLGAALVVAAFGLFIMRSRPDAGRRVAVATATTDSAAKELPTASPTPTPTPQPTVQPSAQAGGGWSPLPLARSPFVPTTLVISKIGVKAAVEVKSVDANNVMQVPDRAFDVAWYNFTAKPGSGGNAVFAGHLDWYGIGPTVFWRLGELTPGDQVEVVSGQQTEIRYRVTQTWHYPANNAPIQSIVARDSQDEVTMITCAGTFSRSRGAYDQRLVVRAVRTND